jgi:hypothetical protein
MNQKRTVCGAWTAEIACQKIRGRTSHAEPEKKKDYTTITDQNVKFPVWMIK